MVQLERKQCKTSELTSRFENIEMYEIDYSLAWKLIQEAQLKQGLADRTAKTAVSVAI